MAHCLIIGMGALGQSLAAYLLNAGHTVTGVRRTPMPSQNGIDYLSVDVTQAKGLSALSQVRADFVIYCVSADNGTPEAYQAAYVDGLQHVISAVSQHPPRWFFFVSSTRVYGQSVDDLLDESCLAMPNDVGGQLLFQGEQLLLGDESPMGANSTVLRFSGIYGPGRERLINLSKHPEQWPEHNAWSNRIHQEDGARFIAFLIDKVLKQQWVAPLYIVTDNCPVGLREVLCWIAKQQGMLLSDDIEQVAGGKRLSNQRLRESGFVLRFPDFKAGYGNLLSS